MSEQNPNNFEFRQTPNNKPKSRESKRSDYFNSMPKIRLDAQPTRSAINRPLPTRPVLDRQPTNDVPQGRHESAAAEQPNIIGVKRHKRVASKKLVLIIAGVIIILGGGLVLAWKIIDQKPIVPKSVSSEVNFTVYYPNPKKLPQGYTLNMSSFKVAIKEGINYTVDYGKNNQIVFSLQPKPTATQLQTFETNYLPLKTAYKTAVGQAEVGAYNLKTLVSLPTSGNTWIILIAPSNINQNQLDQVLNSITE